MKNRTSRPVDVLKSSHLNGFPGVWKMLNAPTGTKGNVVTVSPACTWPAS